MHILLTDRLTCPRCGPTFGLILLSDRMEDRRVVSGRLGCANCRESYPIRGAVADLRPAAERAEDAGGSASGPPAEAVDGGGGAAEDGGGAGGTASPASPAEASEAAVRLAALLGVAGSPGPVLVVGEAGAELAPAVASLVPGMEVVALTRVPGAAGGAAGVSRVVAGAGLPFLSHALRGVALTEGSDAEGLAEALRVTVPGSRVVLDPAPAGAAEALTAAGVEVLLDQQGTVVGRVATGARRGPADGPASVAPPGHGRVT